MYEHVWRDARACMSVCVVLYRPTVMRAPNECIFRYVHAGRMYFRSLKGRLRVSVWRQHVCMSALQCLQ